MASHSNLEVLPNAYEKPPFVTTTTNMAGHPQQYYPPTGSEAAGLKNSEKEKTICGVRRPTFWLTLALVIVIVAAGVGGGVGGTLAVKKIRE